MSIGGSTVGSSAKGRSKQKSQAGSQIEQMAAQFAGETAPLRNQLINQFEQVLKTGGAQATIPLISKAVEESKQATSRSVIATQEDLARKGLAGTPFGANILAQTRQTGEQQTAGIGPAIAQQIFNMVPNFTLAQAQAALSGLGPAVQGNVSQKGSTHGFSMGTQAQGSIGGKG